MFSASASICMGEKNACKNGYIVLVKLNLEKGEGTHGEEGEG